MARNSGIAVAEMEEVVMSSSAGRVGAANDWGAIIGGALAAIVVSIILFIAGAGFGISSTEPWSFTNEAPDTFAFNTGMWLIVMQWLSAAMGGYLGGRLRAKWVGARTDEVLFRDTAHGFLAWALATLVVAALFTVSSGIGATTVATTGSGTSTVSEEALQAAANFSIFTAVSLLVGGFIGAAAGGLGGYHRDAV